MGKGVGPDVARCVVPAAVQVLRPEVHPVGVLEHFADFKPLKIPVADLITNLGGNQLGAASKRSLFFSTFHLPVAAETTDDWASANWNSKTAKLTKSITTLRLPKPIGPWRFIFDTLATGVSFG
jgi:hypothetical protein